MMRKPAAHEVQWTWVLEMEGWEGDKADPRIQLAPSELSAIQDFNTTRAILGGEWYRMEVWIIPPVGQGRPKRHMRQIQSEYKKKPDD